MQISISLCLMAIVILIATTTNATPLTGKRDIYERFLYRRQTGQCNTGNVQCCQQVVDKGSSAVTPYLALLSLLGINLSDITGQIGLQCSPITAIGGSVLNANCAAQPACCSNNNFNSLIAINCSPISLGR